MATSKEIASKEVSEAATASKNKVSIIDQVLSFLSSVPFGVSLLVLMIVFSMIGMLVQQQELETFPKYFAELTPAEKWVYGGLGFFDIYHAWYFKLLLLVLSLNIILASIDYFPRAWNSVRRKKLTASPLFAQTQKVKDEVVALNAKRRDLVARAQQAAKSAGFKTTVTEGKDSTTIFAEKGVWNRFGAYYIHTGLLLIFAGGFLTATRGSTGGMWLSPGRTDDRMVKQMFDDSGVKQVALNLPFEIECTDIQQRLIKPEGSIEASNTLDWITRTKIRDKETGQEQNVLVQLNHPVDYRGYRLFQASFQNFGSARQISLVFRPGNAPQQTISIPRGGSAKLADGAQVKYLEFMPDFQIDRERKPIPASGEYNNPAVQLEIITPDGKSREAWAFNEAFLGQVNNAPFLKSVVDELGGGQFILQDYEKVPREHMLSIQYDPGANVFYLGSFVLGLALVATFFFAHQRLWIVVEDGRVSLGGDANRNKLGFEDRVRKIAARIRQPLSA
jgi:cytochrome c biogenesis protein